MTEATCLAELTRLRQYGAEQWPELAALWQHGALVVDRAVPQFALDQFGNVYANPAFLTKRYKLLGAQAFRADLVGRWLRALGHLLVQHGLRARAISAEAWRWQLAAELALPAVPWPEAPLATGAYPPSAEQLGLPTCTTAEAYYELLKQRTIRPQIEEQGARFGAIYLWDGGSGVHGIVRRWELWFDAPEQQAAQHWELAMVLAQLRAQPGLEDSELARWWSAGQAATKPKVNWHKLLQQHIQQAWQQQWGQRLDYTYQRPARRSWGTPTFILPSLGMGPPHQIAVVLDVSASMSRAYLRQALAEVMSLLAQYRVPLTLIPCDTQVDSLSRLVNPAQLQQWTIPRGGGTDLRTGIAAALAQRPRPTLILVLTDGYTPWPAVRPPVPLLVSLLQFAQQSSSVELPGWARLVQITIP
ncbi:MAG: hypothetical protein D6772_17530 [Bacteroidetes bacterium]|nr:MAG: hypothetical protein D6772_17530 [Bacteroidota bacterium]